VAARGVVGVRTVANELVIRPGLSDEG